MTDVKYRATFNSFTKNGFFAQGRHQRDLVQADLRGKADTPGVKDTFLEEADAYLDASAKERLLDSLGKAKPGVFLALEGSGETAEFNARDIFACIKDRKRRLHGHKWLKRDFRGVEVEPPGSVEDIGTTMSCIADLAKSGMGNEYGLSVYLDQEGEVRTVAQRGGWFMTQVQSEPLVIFPDGNRAALMGIVAHTHPYGAPKPSGPDHAYMAQASENPYSGLRYGVLAVPGGDWSVFDARSAFKVGAGLASHLPLSALFENFYDQTVRSLPELGRVVAEYKSQETV